MLLNLLVNYIFFNLNLLLNRLLKSMITFVAPTGYRYFVIILNFIICFIILSVSTCLCFIGANQ